MAKSRRKIYATQQDKVTVALAKKMKERGLLSKQAKLHGGHYISQGVLKKVRELKTVAALNYKGHKVSRAVAKAAKERGYSVIMGNRIIGPAEQRFTRRLKRGELTGIIPVKGGFMEQVTLPHTVFDFHTLIEQLGEGIDSLKLPDEQFAFTYRGHKSLVAFPDTESLLKRFLHYESRFNQGELPENTEDELFDSFVIFRLHREDVPANIPSRDERRAMRKRQMTPTGRSYSGPTRAEKLDRMHPDRAARQRARYAERDRLKREKIRANASTDRIYKEASKLRAKASRDRKKLK